MIQGQLLVSLCVHKVIQVTIVVEILHLLCFNVSGGILVGGAEGSFENRTCHDVLKAGTYERGALTGLNVLKIDDGPDLSVYFYGYALPEIASHDHKELPPK